MATSDRTNPNHVAALADAELTGDDMTRRDVIEALEQLRFTTSGSRRTLRIDREVRTFLLDALRRA